MIKKLFKYIGTFLFIITLLLVSGKLFFEPQFDAATQQLMKRVFPSQSNGATLRVALSSDIISFLPTTSETNSRGFLMNVYDSLIRPNKFLQLKPQLALSWGLLDDQLTWEFKLRKGVKFHDGSDFDADDVIESIRHAKDDPKSGIRSLLTNIETYVKKDAHTIHIKTKTTDVIFPRRLSSVLIFPSDANPKSPIGTGPYILSEQTKGKSLILIKNPHYWGPLPKYHEVEFQVISDVDARIEAVKQEKIDIVLNVPPHKVPEVGYYNYTVVVRPALEATFIFFNLDDYLLGDKNVRKALIHAIPLAELEVLTSSFISPLSQFVPSGIVGYDQSIKKLPYSLETTQELLNLAGFKRLSLNLLLDERLDVLAEHLQKSLSKSSITLTFQKVPDAKLIQSLKEGKHQMYFLGWRFDLGDIGDFLAEVVHSPTEDGAYGKLNFLNYSNPEVDDLIEESFKTINPADRGRILRRIMQIIVQEDVIGIPLFESKALYAHAPHIKWEPRFDSYFLAHEVK